MESILQSYLPLFVSTKGGLFITSLYIDTLTALTHRTASTHENHPQLLDELSKAQAGANGENFIIQILEQQGYRLLTDITFSQQQMDLIILHEKFCAIFEVKNMKGNIQITESPRQMIRTLSDGTINIFSSPISQLENNIRVMRQFFTEQKINLPIYAAIVFAFPTAKVQIQNRKFPVVFGKDVVLFLDSLDKGDPIYSKRQLNSIANKIKAHDEPFISPFLMAKHNITSDDIRKGCRCNECNFIPMSRLYGKWICPCCHAKSKNAHLQALKEYASFISDTITVKEAMQFLNVDNRHVALRMLYQSKATKTGNTRNTKYKLNKK